MSAQNFEINIFRLSPWTDFHQILQILNLHLHPLHDCDCKDRSRGKQFEFYVHINLKVVPFYVMSKFRELFPYTYDEVFHSANLLEL